MTINDLLFVGFGKRVAALDRRTGQLVWQWQAPKGRSYVTLLLEDDRLVVAVDGYIYCLEPMKGTLIWSNPMTGFGAGVTSLASTRGGNSPAPLSQAAQQAARAAAAAAGS